MPPRYVYWTILIDGKATAFRAREREELMPTVAQLRRTSEDVALRYFSKGKLWDSPEQAQWADQQPPRARERRGVEWRPGGTHRDPRARVPSGTRQRRESSPAVPASRPPRDPRASDRPQADRWPKGARHGSDDRRSDRRTTERPPRAPRPHESRQGPPRDRDAKTGSARPRDERERRNDIRTDRPRRETAHRDDATRRPAPRPDRPRGGRPSARPPRRRNDS